MANTPAGQFPAVTEGTRFRFNFTIGTWWAIGSTLITAVTVLIGFVLWLNAMHTDIAAGKVAQDKQGEMLEDQAKMLRRIEDTVRDIEFRQRYGIPSSISRAPGAAP
jgi:hypothetical protein